MTPEEAELLKNIGQQVRYHRKLRNFTQEELGERASICHKYLGEIERGNKNIGLLVICRIARALQISPADLMSCSPGEADPPRNEMSWIVRLLADRSEEDLKGAFQILRLYFKRDAH